VAILTKNPMRVEVELVTECNLLDSTSVLRTISSVAERISARQMLVEQPRIGPCQ
jgi:hypothetical protein